MSYEQKSNEKLGLTSFKIIYFGTFSVYQCGICSLSVETPIDLRNHMRTHASTADYVCYLCKKVFWERPVLERHMKQHCIAPETCPCVLKKNNCKVCPEQCKEDPTPKGYRKRCSICQKILHNKCEYHAHMCRDGVNSVRCEYCSESFESIIYLLEHLSIMHDDMNFYKCQKCSKIFSMVELHTLHMQVVHYNDGEMDSAAFDVKPINIDSAVMGIEKNKRVLKRKYCIYLRHFIHSSFFISVAEMRLFLPFSTHRKKR